VATKEDIERHYDVDNDFFSLFLDSKYLTYTCAVWDSAYSLITAQEAKFDRLCKFANVQEGSHVMDVGCGWGGLMNYIADNYDDASAHGLTISNAQYSYMNQESHSNVSVSLCPWQEFKLMEDEQKFDSIISVCAFEHFATLGDQVNFKQREIYESFFDWCLEVSTEDAQFALQCIVITRLPENVTELRDTKFILEKVFPGSALPSISDIQSAIVDRYEISAAKRIGHHYVRTLQVWKDNLEASKSIAIERFGQDVYDHHIKYLDAARRCFESGYTDLYQISLKRAKPVRIFAA